jgi:hypothetical protein
MAIAAPAAWLSPRNIMEYIVPNSCTLLCVIIYLFPFLHLSANSRDSSVGIEMGYELNARGLDPGRGMIFSFTAACRPALGPNQSPGE